MLNTKKKSGFTIIEILVALAIIGIISAYSYANYQTYAIRSRVSEAFDVIKNCELDLAREAQRTSSFPLSYAAAPVSCQKILGNLDSTYVQSFEYRTWVVNSGVCTSCYLLILLKTLSSLQDASGSYIGVQYNLVNGNIEKACGATAVPATPKKYLPQALGC